MFLESVTQFLGLVAGEPEETTFTQEDVNKFLAEDRRKHQAKVVELQAELAKLKTSSTERDALQQKVTELNNTLLSKEELAKVEAQRLKDQAEIALKTANDQAAKWRSNYENTLADSAITKAAASHKAFNPEQIKLILANRVQVKPELDEQGAETGNFKVVMTSHTKDGKTIEMTVDEGIKEMRANEGFANLFLAEGSSGTGSITINNRPGSSDPTKPPADPREYRQWREKAKQRGDI